MKQIIYILFLALSLFYTEGGIAQGTFDTKDLQPFMPDSSQLSNVADTIATKPVFLKRATTFVESQKHYMEQPLEAKNIDKNAWERAKKGIDYKNDKLKKQTQQTPNFSFNPKWGVAVELLKWFFIIGAIILLAYLILRFIGEGNIWGIKKRHILDPSVEINLEQVEENLENANLDPLIRQAIANKNYTLAVRLYYLAILKELHLKEAINWKKDKTNRTYVREMRENRFFEPFRHTTNLFEQVWYGSQNIDESGFEAIQPDFQNLLKNIK